MPSQASSIDIKSPLTQTEHSSGEVSHAGADLTGRFVQQYRIVELLGSGGMGVVYRAMDTVLGRPVALKFLSAKLPGDPLARARFVRGAQAVSALDDPNIGVVHEIGEYEGALFIAMALYEGETLEQRMRRGAMSVADVTDILSQVASALAAVHAAGIVHRDVKPANIMIAGGGRVKLLDFGVAKFLESAEESLLTGAGQLLGTVAYMSPEQACGKTVDGRSDLFSLGVVAYEMLTGVSPFLADNKAATLQRISHGAPARIRRLRPRTPDAMVEFVARLLRKEPRDRAATADEVLRSLRSMREPVGVIRAAASAVRVRAADALDSRAFRWLFAVVTVFALVGAGLAMRTTAPAVAALPAVRQTIAVLPFDNLGSSADTDYLSDGLTAELADKLSRVPGLHVASLAAARRYKKQGMDPVEVGARLGALSILTGRVSQRGSELHVDIEFVETNTRARLWGHDYVRSLDELPQLQSDLFAGVSQWLRPSLTSVDGAKLARTGTSNPEAYRYFLKGQHHLRKLETDAAREYFEKAIAVDPLYAPAHASLGGTFASRSGIRTLLPSPYEREKALRAARRAIELDELLAQPYVTLAGVSAMYEWDWPAADGYYKQAIAADPNDASVRHSYAHFLAAVSLADEAFVQSLKAVELEPSESSLLACLGSRYKDMGQFDTAVEHLLTAMAMSPTERSAYFYLAEAYAQQGRFDAALGVIDGMPDSVKHEVLSNPGVQGFAPIYALAGKVEEARRGLSALKTVAKLKTNATYRIARTHAALGEIDEAFAWLEQAMSDKAPVLMDVNIDPMFASLRSDSRYATLIARMRLDKGVGR